MNQATARTVLLCILILLSVYQAQAQLAGTWETRSNGLTSLFIVDVTIDPDSPSRIFATTRGQGVWRSLDGTASWVKCSTGIPDWGPPYGHLLHDAVVIDASDPDILYTISAPSLTQSTYGRIYKSTNGGDSWSLSTSGASVGGWYGITGIAQDPTDVNHLFAGSIVTGYGGGIFESTNRGTSWVNIAGSEFPGDGDLNNDAWPIRIDPTNPLNLYCGSPHDAMLYSRDGGYTWTESNPAGYGSDTSCYEVELNPLDPTEVWIGHADGTFRSDDSGENWNNVSSMFGGDRIVDLEFAPSNPNVAYAVTDAGLFRSSNNGTSWSLVTDQISFGRCLAVHPTNANTLFMGTWGRGIFKSTNGGADWEMVNEGMPVTALIDIDYVVADPTESGKVYCHLRGNGLYGSDDYGETWNFIHQLKSYYMDSFLIHPDNPDIMLYTWYELYRSIDGGVSWTTILPSPDDQRYRGLELDPHRDRIWVVDSNYDDGGSRILYSDNRGLAWSPAPAAPGNPPLDQYTDIAIDPTDANTILVSGAPKWSTMMENGWVFRSDDGGYSWTRIKEGLELRNWNIVAGQWYVASNHLTQNNWNSCSVRASIRDVVVHSATYEVRTRVTAVLDGDTQHWSGMSICRPSETSAWTDGVLIGMRRNGDVFLWAAGASEVYATGAVSNAANYQTIGARVTGDTYTLLLNGSELGSWTDTGSGWGDGYVCLATCRARADFDDVSITGPPDFFDDFNIGNWGNGYNLSQVEFSPTEPGVAYVIGGGEGVYRSEDHGLTWERITSSSDETLYFYDLMVSRFPGGNVYFTKGSFFPSANFITGVYSQGATVFDQLGQPATNYYRSPLAEDATRPNVLYGGEYGPGFEMYVGSVPGTSGIEGSWMFLR